MLIPSTVNLFHTDGDYLRVKPAKTTAAITTTREQYWVLTGGGVIFTRHTTEGTSQRHDPLSGVAELELHEDIPQEQSCDIRHDPLSRDAEVELHEDIPP